MKTGEFYGMFVRSTDDGSSLTSKVKRYPTYQDMVNDESPSVYAIVDENNTVYHRENDQWIVGFPNVSNSSDYSAFEVMPNKTTIAVGTLDELTGITYKYAVNSCTTHKMTIRSLQEPTDCDVVIDWGDGTVDSIANGDYVSHSVGSSYEVSHDYSTSMSSDIQRFIVKIYGKDYWAFRHNSYQNNNLISRIFAADLPIANHIGNFASMAIYSHRLLKVKFPKATKPYSEVWNWSACFGYCENLSTVTGFSDIRVRDDAIVNQIFIQDYSLETVDFVIPAGCNDIYSCFKSCQNLTNDINTLLPANGFKSVNIRIVDTFAGASRITGTVPAAKLWNDPKINWIVESTDGQNLVFSHCSASILSQVPTSWGGTKVD